MYEAETFKSIYLDVISLMTKGWYPLFIAISNEFRGQIDSRTKYIRRDFDVTSFFSFHKEIRSSARVTLTDTNTLEQLNYKLAPTELLR